MKKEFNELIKKSKSYSFFVDRYFIGIGSEINTVLILVILLFSFILLFLKVNFVLILCLAGVSILANLMFLKPYLRDRSLWKHRQKIIRYLLDLYRMQLIQECLTKDIDFNGISLIVEKKLELKQKEYEKFLV